MPLINFSGLASGIDSEALIEALSEASRKTKVTPHETRIAELEETNDALTELKTKVLSLKSILDSFSTLYGGPLGMMAGSTDETIITASASNTATPGSYSISVSQMAKNGSYSLASDDVTYTSPNSVINGSISDVLDAATFRTANFLIGTGADQESIDIVVSSTTTLNEFVEDFNNQSDLATASVVNKGSAASPDYVVLIVSKYEGTEKGTIAVDLATNGSNILGAGVGAFDDNASSAAQNAVFTVGGIGGDITRQSNTVADLIPGVTFNINSTGTADISVDNDVDETIANVREFIDAYNEIVQLIDENNEITREENGEDVNNIFGSLAKTRVDDNILSSIRSDMAAASITTGTTVKIFAELGITTERDGTLKLDEDDLEAAINNEADSVKSILQNLGNSAGLTDGTLDQFVRFNGLLDVAINGNKESITNLGERISRAEAQIARSEETLRARFARLETQLSQLQSQQSALTSIIGSLGA